jgi:hypothetical protein
MAFGEPNSYNVAWNGQVKSRDAAAWRRDERRNDGGHRSSEGAFLYRDFVSRCILMYHKMYRDEESKIHVS